ncbi:MAG TPA: O-antigen ligase family protein [Kiritimatiellia bacterium]|nr:O-antigen ligase family protein [Kiritimatiellia bacterium]HMO99218.1 O-antigen ligase family protein [Kiritimatiellia bacterium]HMP96009.1 O-antigen ligase family protein [Kiritimatiellia bacterium]
MRGAIPGGSDTRRRRRKSSLPGSLLALDYVVLILLLLVAAGVMWVLGGNRMWISAPVILAVMALGIVGVSRFFLSNYRSTWVIPAGGAVGVVFLTYLVVIRPFAEISYEAGQEMFRYVSYVVAYFLWVNVLRVNDRWRWSLALVFLSISGMAWYAMIQHAQGTNMVVLTVRPDDYGMRASGAYICPNHFANLLAMAIPVALGLLFSPGAGVALKLFAGYTALICLYPLFLTLSRSGWISLMVSLVVFAVLMATRKGIKRVLMVALLAPLLVGTAGVVVWKMSPQVQKRVAQAIQGDIRIPLWQDTITMIERSPIIGNGLGSYRYMYAHFRDKLPMIHDPEFAHNDYLHFWSDIGVIGLGLGLLMMLAVTVRMMRMMRRDQDDRNTPMMAGMLAMLAGVAAHTLFDFNLHIFANVHVMVFLIAAAVAATYDPEVDRTVSFRGVVSARAWGAVLIALLAFGLLVYGRKTISYFYELDGESHLLASRWENAQGQFARAYAVAPGNWRAHLAYAHALRTRSFWMRNPEVREPWIDEAIRHYEIAGQLNPWEPGVWFGLGGLYKMRGDDEAALAMRRKTVERIPRHSFYLNALGQQLRDMGQLEEALAVFQQSMVVEPTTLAERNIQILRRRLTAQPTPENANAP